MIIDKLRKSYYASIIFFVLIELIALVAFAYLAMLYNHIFSEGLIIFIIGTIGFWYLTITRIRENYRLCMQGKFKVVTLDNKLYYPTYFHKNIRLPLFIWGKGYYSKKRIIPKRFISFVEGYRAYPIQEIDEIVLNNHYEILYIHRGYAALIQDMNKKQFLVHMSNLETIE